jgi:hydrogenase maturation protease
MGNGLSMTDRCDALVLGIGNVLWADEGFGVRAVEALHAKYELPDTVAVVDGGTQGLYLFAAVAAARRILLFDAIDFGLPPGTLRVLRDREVPASMPAKVSPHQTGFNDILALAQLRGEAPETITLIGVQPEELSDLGGSLRDIVKARIPQAVEIAASELAAWGLPPRRRDRESAAAPLNAPALALALYEGDRPSSDEACRIGDARVLSRARV